MPPRTCAASFWPGTVTYVFKPRCASGVTLIHNSLEPNAHLLHTMTPTASQGDRLSLSFFFSLSLSLLIFIPSGQKHPCIFTPWRRSDASATHTPADEGEDAKTLVFLCRRIVPDTHETFPLSRARACIGFQFFVFFFLPCEGHSSSLGAGFCSPTVGTQTKSINDISFFAERS